MRDSVHTEIMEAAEAFEETIQPLELRSDKTAQLAAHFKVADAQIALLAQDYMALKCAANDKGGFDLVHTARMDVKDLRVQVDKTRKGLVSDALEWQRTVNAEAKRITGLLEPIETHLEKQEAIYTAEQDRIKAERQREAQARVQIRIDALAGVGVTANLADIALMPDEAFQRYLALETESFARAEAVKAEAKAKADAEETERVARVKAEAERLEAMRKEQAEVQAKLDAQTAALKAERDAIEAEKAKAAQAVREEQIRKDAAEKAKAEADTQARAEVVRLEVEAARAAEVEAARPDADKLIALSRAIESLSMPVMSTERGNLALAKVGGLMAKLVTYALQQAEGLAK